MRPLLSLAAALGLLGAAFSLIHVVSLRLNLPDLVAMMLFAAPVVYYCAYCTRQTRGEVWRAALTCYLGFAGVLLAAAALVYFIGRTRRRSDPLLAGRCGF